MTRRLFSLFIAFLLIVSLFTGCVTSVQTVPDSSPKDSMEPVSNFNPKGYPVVNEKISFTCMNSRTAGFGKFGDMLLFEKYEELTNIHMEWQDVASTDFPTKLGLVLAAGEMPDWIYGNIDYNTLFKYGTEAKMFYDLTDLIKKYMPNLMSWTDDYWFILPSITMADGRILSVPHFYSTPVGAASTMYLRTDMLETIGREIPTTVDEFYDLLIAFRDSNLFGEEFVPYITRSVGIKHFCSGEWANYLFPAFGDATAPEFAEDGKGNVVYNFISEQFRRYLEFTAKCFSEKLIDQDVFTMDAATAISKLRANNCAVTNGGTSLSIDNFDSGTFDLVLLAPLTSSYTNTPKFKNQGWGTGPWGVVNSNCENVEALIRWFDVGYTKEISIEDSGIGIGLFEYGIYGYNYKWDNEEMTSITTWIPSEYSEVAANMSDQEFRYAYMSPYFRISSAVENITNFSDPAQTVKATETIKNIFPYMEDTIFPDSFLRLTNDEQDLYADLYTDIDTYSKSEIAKFITGLRPMSEWDNYVNEIKKMGIDDVLKIKQEAYSRYLKIFK